MPAYRVFVGRNTAGTCAAELRADPDHPEEKRLARSGFRRISIGVVNGYGLDEAGAVGAAVRKARAIEAQPHKATDKQQVGGES